MSSSEYPTDTCARDANSQPPSEDRISPREAERFPDELPSARREGNTVPAHSPAGRRQLCSVLLHIPNQIKTPVPSRVPVPRATHALRGQYDSQDRIGSANTSKDVFLPPPYPMVNIRGGQRFLVEHLLNYRDVKNVGRVTSSGSAAIRLRCIVGSLARS